MRRKKTTAEAQLLLGLIIVIIYGLYEFFKYILQ